MRPLMERVAALEERAASQPARAPTYPDGMKHFVIIDSGRAIAAFKTGQVLTSNQAVTNLNPLEAQRLDQEMDNLTVHWGGPGGANHI